MRTSILFVGALLAGPAQAASWCSNGHIPANTVDRLQREVDRLAAAQPRAMARIHTQGTLPHQGIRDQSIEAEKDLTVMRDLAMIWRAGHDGSALERLAVLLDAWAGVYQPSFNQIDETVFDKLIDAYAITQDALPEATRNKAAQLIRAIGAGYIARMQHPPKRLPANNSQSHRIKLATLAAVALDDAEMFNAARELFREQIGRNLSPDGMSIDFELRDALHYVVYDLEPLTRAAIAARTRGEEWLYLEGSNHATLASGLNWLLPYASGEKTHEEYVRTTVQFDRERRDAGVGGFKGLWKPAKSADLYGMAATLDARYLPLARSLAAQAAWMGACW